MRRTDWRGQRTSRFPWENLFTIPEKWRYVPSSVSTVIVTPFPISDFGSISVGSKAGTYPTLDGNTYIQTRRAFLGSFRGSQKYTFGKEAKTIIKNEFGDPDPKVIQAG